MAVASPLMCSQLQSLEMPLQYVQTSSAALHHVILQKRHILNKTNQDTKMENVDHYKNLHMMNIQS